MFVEISVTPLLHEEIIICFTNKDLPSLANSDDYKSFRNG